MSSASTEKKQVVSAFWLTAWSFTLSWCWLLPNHYLPWSSFHTEAWAAALFLLMGAAVLWQTRQIVRLPTFCVAIFALSVTPWLQYVAGLSATYGAVWLAFSYLIAFALVIVVGYRWDLQSPLQVGDGLFMAIGIASLLSVGLQLHQWLELNLFEIWSMGNGLGRPYANFGQPNQLGTFLLWGALALYWGALRFYIRPSVLMLGVIFIMFGVALTASRTAWLGVTILVFGAWHWRHLWPWRRTPWLVTLAAVSFFFFTWIIPFITRDLLLTVGENQLGDLVRVSSESRPQIWKLLIDAMWQKPWFGYGWNQIGLAQLAVALDHPPLKILLAQAHNLFLDLFLYCGIPLGLLISFVLIAWLWRCFRSIQDASSATMFLLILVVGNHAMFEFPLHYAYFLLPVGLVIGALNARTIARTVEFGQRWLAGVTWLICAALLSLITRDYFRVEASYQVLRFEWANLDVQVPRAPPDVLLFDQLRDLIVFSRFEPSPGMSVEQLNWMLHVADLYPGAGVVHKLVIALVWNDRPDEAVMWLRRMCAVTPQPQCDAIRNALKNQAKTDARIAAVIW